jgi:aminoglycoside 2'-N-acetyltransferase I
MRVVSLPTRDVGPARLEELHRLFDAAWSAKEGKFDENDWRAALGGTHFILEERGMIVSHGSVIGRRLEVDGRPMRTGYVEAMATLPERQRQGLGTLVMREINAYIERVFQLGAMAASLKGFYGPLGWERWPGRTGVRTANGVRLTPEEDGAIFVRFAGLRPDLDDGSLLVCDAQRPGDPW